MAYHRNPAPVTPELTATEKAIAGLRLDHVKGEILALLDQLRGRGYGEHELRIGIGHTHTRLSLDYCVTANNT